MIYLQLFYEFMKIGLFSVGGGYAALPFLYHISENYNWYNLKELNEILAISNITPGPVGINMATFAGYKAASVFGSIVAVSAIIIPALIVTTIVAKFLDKFEENEYIVAILDILKPTACAMISGVGIKLFALEMFNIKALNLKSAYSSIHIDYICLALFIFLLILSQKIRLNPIAVVGLSSIIGYILIHTITI